MYVIMDFRLIIFLTGVLGRLTDCGGSCIVGEILITTQGCDDKYGNPTGVSQLCCPVDSAPDPKTCTWRGDWPACNGRCHDDEVALEQNK